MYLSTHHASSAPLNYSPLLTYAMHTRQLEQNISRQHAATTAVHSHCRRPHGYRGDCLTTITPPCEELDPPYDIKLVLCRKLHLFLGKSTKTAATRAALFDSNMHQIICRLRLRPRPTGELTALPQPLAVFRGPTSKERGSEGRERGELVGA